MQSSLYSNWKLMTGLGFVLVFVILVGLYYSFSQLNQTEPGTTLSNQSALNHDKKVVPTVVSSSETVVGKNQQTWKQFQSADIRFSYPPDWTVTSSPVVGNGVMYVVVPATDATGLQPKMTIQYLPSSQSAFLQTGKNIFLSFGFTQSVVQVAGHNFTAFSGIFPMPSGAQTVQKQSTIMATEMPESNYLIEYSYIGKKKNSTLKGNFQKIISTIQLP